MAAPTFVTSIEPTSNWGSTAIGAVRTTGSFSVLAGDVLVVVEATENSTFTSTTPTGGSLTWTSVKAAAFSDINEADVRSWTATVDVDKSMTFSLTAATGTGARSWGFVVYQFRGSDGVGASAITQQISGSTSASQALTTLAANSAILAISADWNAIDGATRTWATINSVTPTSGNGLERIYFRNASAYTVYSAYWSDVGATGSKSAGVSAPTGQRNSIIAIEIKGSTSVSPVAKRVIIPQARVRAAFW